MFCSSRLYTYSVFKRILLTFSNFICFLAEVSHETKSDSTGAGAPNSANGKGRPRTDKVDQSGRVGGGVRISKTSTTDGESRGSQQQQQQQQVTERTNGLAIMPEELGLENNNDILKLGANLRPNAEKRGSDEESYEQFDIVGDTSNARFPWQCDVTTQCDDNILTLERSVQTDQQDVVCEKCNSEKALQQTDRNSPSLLHRVFRGSPNSARKKGKLIKQTSLDCMIPARDYGNDNAFLPTRPRSKSALPTSRPNPEHLIGIPGLGSNFGSRSLTSKQSLSTFDRPFKTIDQERWLDNCYLAPSPLPSPLHSPILPVSSLTDPHHLCSCKSAQGSKMVSKLILSMKQLVGCFPDYVTDIGQSFHLVYRLQNDHHNYNYNLITETFFLTLVFLFTIGQFP